MTPVRPIACILGPILMRHSRKGLAGPLVRAQKTLSGPELNQGCPITKSEMVTREPEDNVASRNTPQSGIPQLKPKAPQRPMLPGAKLRDNTPTYDNNYAIQMLDVLDNPSFINPWALPSMTTQALQGLVQPIPQPRGARPKDVTQQMQNERAPTTQSEVSGMTGPLQQGRTSAPSIVTSVGPSVSQVGEPSIVEPGPNVYERHDKRYPTRHKQVKSIENPMGTVSKVSIHSTPEVTTEQETQRDSVPMN